MEIRLTTEADVADVMRIYESARKFMAEHGNPNQWGPNKWPPEQLIHEDIAAGKSYVCTEGGKVVGTFYYDEGDDIEPSYRVIEDGAWPDDSAYGVVHRLASDGSVRGVARVCLDWAFDQCGHLRVDTHGDNAVMRQLLEKAGFKHCGTIYVEQDDYPRLAYEKSVLTG